MADGGFELKTKSHGGGSIVTYHTVDGNGHPTCHDDCMKREAGLPWSERDSVEKKVTALFEQVLDVATETVPGPEESFVHCLVCDEWEGHKDGCPIEAIEKWRNK